MVPGLPLQIGESINKCAPETRLKWQHGTMTASLIGKRDQKRAIPHFRPKPVLSSPGAFSLVQGAQQCKYWSSEDVILKLLTACHVWCNLISCRQRSQT